EPTRRWFSTLQDLTDQRLVQEELARLNRDLESRVVDRTAKLEAANRELEAFSYSVSHDLRAPLRHIQGYAELLAAASGERIPDKARRYIGIIEDAAREMSVLIDDLLMFSRSARTEMHRGIVPLGPLVGEAIATLEDQEPGRRIEWHVG